MNAGKNKTRTKLPLSGGNGKGTESKEQRSTDLEGGYQISRVKTFSPGKEKVPEGTTFSYLHLKRNQRGWGKKVEPRGHFLRNGSITVDRQQTIPCKKGAGPGGRREDFRNHCTGA